MIILANATEVFTTIGFIIVGLLALTFMIVIHELGHYLVGKLLGFKILEFGIGFGPPLFKRKNKKNGEIFSIRPIPLGGFCRFESEDENSDSPTAFDNQPAWKRILTLLAGATFNLISAFIIISIFFAVFGQVTLKVDNVFPDSVNKFEKGDVFLTVNGRQLNILEAQDSTKLLSKAGETAVVVVLRNGKTERFTITKSDYQLGKFDENGVFEPDLIEGKPQMKHGFGISTSIGVHKLSYGLSLKRTFSFTFFVVYKVFEIFGRLFTGKIGVETLGGPVTTIKVMTDASRSGPATLLYAVSIISANLAVMNLLPIPALDGSRIIFCIIEMIRRKPISKKIQGIVNAIGFIALITFAILIDILKLF